MLAARSTFIAAYNNVSHIDDAPSDWLCCLVEGTAINKRTLYTTAGETILAVKRPVLLNGIGSAAVRGDLLDRSLLVAIQPPTERKSEEELWASYDEARPRILGALLSAVSLRPSHDLPKSRFRSRAPRLLDFVRLATAAEPGLGLEAGAVLRGMLENKQEASQRATEAVAWVPAICLLMEREKEWKGTSSELLQALQQEECRPPRNRRGNCADWIGWPKGAQPLSNALSRLAPDLETLGITIEIGKTHGQRWLRLAFNEHA